MQIQKLVNDINGSFSGCDVRKLVRAAIAGMANPLAYLETVKAALVPTYTDGKNWRIHEVETVMWANGGVKVGMGATAHHYSDATAYTVVAISKSGKQVTLQADIATLDPNFKPDFIPGGFVGHVANNAEQTYTYAPNPKAERVKARLHKDGYFYLGSSRIGFGYRAAFHDYNF